jgi:hypothetical protein
MLCAGARKSPQSRFASGPSRTVFRRLVLTARNPNNGKEKPGTETRSDDPRMSVRSGRVPAGLGTVLHKFVHRVLHSGVETVGW